MTRAVIVSTARTPLAKSWKGAFNMTHGATLGGLAIQAAVERAGVVPGAAVLDGGDRILIQFVHGRDLTGYGAVDIYKMNFLADEACGAMI